MTEFDWELYLHPLYNEDLRANGIRTKEAAQWHWANHGQREGRIASASNSSDPMNRIPPNFNWLDYQCEKFPTKAAVINAYLDDHRRTELQLQRTSAPEKGEKRVRLAFSCEVVEEEGWVLISTPEYCDKYLMSLLLSQALEAVEEVSVHWSGLPNGFTLNEQVLTAFRKWPLTIHVRDLSWLWSPSPAPAEVKYCYLSQEHRKNLNLLFRQAKQVIYASEELKREYRGQGIRHQAEPNNLAVIVTSTPNAPYIRHLLHFDRLCHERDQWLIQVASPTQIPSLLGYDRVILHLNEPVDLSAVQSWKDQGATLIYTMHNEEIWPGLDQCDLVITPRKNPAYPRAWVQKHPDVKYTNPIPIRMKIDPREPIRIGYYGSQEEKARQRLDQTGVWYELTWHQPHLFICEEEDLWSYSTSYALSTGLPIILGEKQAWRGGKSWAYLEELLAEVRQGTSTTYPNPSGVIYFWGIYENLYGRNLEQPRITLSPLQKYPDEEVRLFGMYFPQFHRINANEANHYPGYTDMANLAHLKMINPSYHTTTPLLGYYDLELDEDILPTQMKLCRSYGLYGFMIYHYWFQTNTQEANNHAIMDSLIARMFEQSAIVGNYPLFFCWANEPWTRVAYLSPNETVRLLQDYDDEVNLRAHAQYLTTYFLKPNYYKVKGKPVFAVHHPFMMSAPQLQKMVQVLTEVAVRAGLPGVHFLFDGICGRMGGNHDHYTVHLHHKCHGSSTRETERTLIYDYQDDLAYMEGKMPLNEVQNIHLPFDNRARVLFQESQKMFQYRNGSPHEFGRFLRLGLQQHKVFHSESKILLINAVNEQGENMALEPSVEEGYAYLEEIQRALLEY